VRAASGLAFAFAAVSCAEPTPVTPEVPLGPAIWTIEVNGEPHVAEAEDGTIAIAAVGERSLLLVDAQGTPVDSLGRAGEGPGEFRQLGNVFVLADGRFAVVDQALRRVTFVRRGSREMEAVPIPAGHDAATLRITTGGEWTSQRAIGERQDSLAIIGSRSPHESLATIARIHAPATQFIPLGDMAINAAPEYAARDVWGISDAGTWIARGADNSTELVGPDGQLTRFQAEPFARISTVAADRDRWRGLPAPERFKAVARPLAPVKGPFQEVVGSRDGVLWFWLNQPAGHARELYAARRIGSEEWLRLSLPDAHKIVAVGPHHLFVYGMVGDGVFLSAHARPASGAPVREKPGAR
jgi:hypothetical protein